MKSSNIKTIAGRILFFLAVCFIFIMPILSLLRMSLTTDGGFGLQNYVDMLHEERTAKAIRNTLIISVSSTAIAVAAGSFFAFLNAYTNVKRKKLLELLVLAPYIIPSYIITLSWSSLLLKRGFVNTTLKNIGLPVIDIYTLPGIILVMGICNIPVVYLLVVGMLRKIFRLYAFSDDPEDHHGPGDAGDRGRRHAGVSCIHRQFQHPGILRDLLRNSGAQHLHL